jgi:two-component system cell cycle sensor histidine kinase/response regulator CckA
LSEHDTRISADETVALLEETLEATHVGLLVLDLERRIVRYNRQFIQMFGLTEEELDRRGVEAVVAALSTQVEDAADLLVNWPAARTNPSITVLDTLRFKDGRVYERFIAPRSIDGRIVGRVASYRDITQTARAEAAAAQHRTFLEKAQEVAHIGSWVLEFSDPATVTWSAETFRIFGCARDYTPTLDALVAFVHADDREVAVRTARAALDDGAVYDIEHRIVRPDGGVRWVHKLADVVRDGSGKALRMIGTVQDITERRQLEEQLRQSQKLEAIGRLAGGIAHDLNNSLTAIIGYTELALGAMAGSDSARPDVQEVRRAAGRAEAVTRQLLAFSRKQMLEPRVFSLGDAIAGLQRVIESTIGPSITLATAFEQTPPIYGDPGQIEQAILNVVVNARDAMASGGTLSIGVHDTVVDEAFAAVHEPMPLGRYVEVRVSDTGHGMDAVTQAQIFEPFFTTKDVGKGTGLGLSMVYGTVRQSGGYVYVNSAPGKGATFSFFFPPAAAGPAIPAMPAAHTRDTATILVVEDEPAVRTIVTTSLRRKGHRVLQAASADEALQVASAQTEPIDLLLTDANMPGMNGIDLARTLAAERPDMLIVIMSGFTEDTLRLRDAGVAAVMLPKPFSPSELQRTIAEILAGRAPSSAGL